MSQTPSPGPVRVRMYGVVSMTKGRYLLQVALAFVLAAGLMTMWWLRWPLVRNTLRDSRSPMMDRAIAFWDAAPWVIGALATLQAVEAFFVLRKFRRQEAERAAAPGSSRPNEEKTS